MSLDQMSDRRWPLAFLYSPFTLCWKRASCNWYTQCRLPLNDNEKNSCLLSPCRMPNRCSVYIGQLWCGHARVVMFTILSSLKRQLSLRGYHYLTVAELHSPNESSSRWSTDTILWMSSCIPIQLYILMDITFWMSKVCLHWNNYQMYWKRTHSHITHSEFAWFVGVPCGWR